MIRKILFLVNSPLDRRDFERFGIELLMKNSFKVEVWDITDILHPDVRKSYIPPDPIDWPHCRVFSAKEKALNEIKSLPSGTFIIAFIHYIRGRYSVYKAISDSKAEYATILSNAIPTAGIGREQSFLFYLKKLRKVTVKKLLDSGFLRLPFTWLGIKPASLVLAGGKQSLKYSYLVGKITEIVWAHAMDYDFYLKDKNNPAVERPIAVFLDNYLPFHSIQFYRKGKVSASADTYYPLLNEFFDLVEEELGLEIVVAAHPRSHYEKHPDCFQGRKWVRGQTFRLIKESKLVLAHHSLSTNFANLLYKPVIFLTSYELDEGYAGPNIRKRAEWFGKKPIFMDSNSNIDWGFELTVSKEHYDNYRRAYIKTDHSEDLLFWQIVANRLKKRF